MKPHLLPLTQQTSLAGVTCSAYSLNPHHLLLPVGGPSQPDLLPSAQQDSLAGAKGSVLASSQHDLLLPAGSPSRGSTQARRRLQVALQRLAERNQWPVDGDSDDPPSPTSEWNLPVTRWGRCCQARRRLAHFQKLPGGTRSCVWHNHQS